MSILSMRGVLRGAIVIVLTVQLLTCSLGFIIDVEAKQLDPTDDTDGSRTHRGTEPIIDIDGDSEFLQMAQDEGWPGTGSTENPYVIEGYRFDGTGHSIGLQITDVDYYFIIKDCTFDGADTSSNFTWDTVTLWLNWVNCRIENNRFLCNTSRYAVRVYRSSIVFEGNEFWGNRFGIYGEWGDIEIANNTFHGSFSKTIEHSIGMVNIHGNNFIGVDSQSNGIQLDQVSISKIYSNQFSDFYSCIRTDNDRYRPCKALNISRNTLVNVTKGIEVNRANNGLIESNSISSDGKSDIIKPGIELNSCENLTMRDNHLVGFPYVVSGFTRYPDGSGSWNNISLDSSNTIDKIPMIFMKDADGIDVEEGYSEIIIVNCTNIRFRGWTEPMPPYGIIIEQSDSIEFVDNDISSGDMSKVTIKVSNHINITGNKCSQEIWFNMQYNDHIKIIGNEFPSKIWVSLCDFVDIINNSLIDLNRDGGISISGSRDVTIAHNYLSSKPSLDRGGGIGLSYSERTKVIGNEMWNVSGYSMINGDKRLFETLEFDNNNTVDGKPVLCHVNEEDLVISGDFYQVILGNCTRVSIENTSFEHTTIPITVKLCSAITISNVEFIDMNSISVYAGSSSDVTMNNCTSIGGEGKFWFNSVKNATIEENIIQGAHSERWYQTDGIFEIENCKNVAFFKNQIINVSACGVTIDRTQGLVASYNVFKACSSWSIYCIWSSGNKFHHNSFIDNNLGGESDPPLPQCMDGIGGNEWDEHGYGNYWSDYTTKYPNANNDGVVWNESYQIDGYNDNQDRLDNYPLIRLIDPFPPILPEMDDIHVDQHTMVRFDSRATDNVGVPNHTWVFKYGSEIVTLHGVAPTFMFDLSGEYPVDLFVVDPAGNGVEDHFTVHVRDIEPPECIAGEDRTIAMHEELVLDGSNSLDNRGIVTWEWEVSNGPPPIIMRGPKVTVKFDVPGEFEQTLTVTDAAGNTASDTVVIQVIDVVPPVADPGDDIEVDMNTSVTFYGNGSYDNVGITRWTWSFEEGDQLVTLDGEVVKYTFIVPGLYIVTLEVEDGFGMLSNATISVNIIDTEPPVAVIILGKDPQDLYVLTTFGLLGTASTDNVEIVNWSWRISDGKEVEFLYGPIVEFKIIRKGTHIVELTLMDSSGLFAMTNISFVALEIDEDDDGLPMARIGALIIIAVVVATMVVFLYRFKVKNVQ